MLSAQSLCVIMRSQNDGNMIFNGHNPSVRERNNAEESRRLCGRIERQLLHSPANEIAILLSSHNILHAIGYGRMPEPAFTDRYRRLAIGAWKDGDTRIEESDIFGLIILDSAYLPGKADSECAALHQSLKTKWLETLSKYGRYPDATTKENYERLAFIMRENIDRHFNENAAEIKRKWYEANRINDLAMFSTTILRTYRRFITSLYPDVLTYKEQLALDNRVLEELITRHDLNPYYREAYRIAISLNRRNI